MDDGSGQAAVHPGKFLIAGYLINVTECITFYPLEVLKTRQQFDSRIPTGAEPTSRSAYRLSQSAFLGQLRQLVREQGLRSAYRGLSWYTTVGVPWDVLHYYGYTAGRDYLLSTSVGKQYPTLAYAGSGVVADVLALTVFVPVDVVTQRMQVAGLPQPGLSSPNDQPQRLAASPRTRPAAGGGSVRWQRTPQAVATMPSTAHAAGDATAASTARVSGLAIARRILATEGWRGLFRGLGVVAALQAPASAVWWAVSEHSQRPLAHWLRQDQNASSVHMLSGALAGFVTTVAMNPFDVLKTRLQTSERRVSVAEHFRLVRQQHGLLQGFTKGLQPRLLSNVPRSGLAFVIYQLTVQASRSPWPLIG